MGQHGDDALLLQGGAGFEPGDARARMGGQHREAAQHTDQRLLIIGVDSASADVTDGAFVGSALAHLFASVCVSW